MYFVRRYITYCHSHFMAQVNNIKTILMCSTLMKEMYLYWMAVVKSRSCAVAKHQ